MCAAVEYAMKDSRLGTDGKSPCNIFVVHEAEAQAMHTLTQMSQLTVNFHCLPCFLQQLIIFASEARPSFSWTAEVALLTLESTTSPLLSPYDLREKSTRLQV